MNPRIAIVGATGAVGKMLMDLIEERNFPYESIDLVASSRSAGSTVQFQGREFVVKDLAMFDFSHTDIAFYSAGTATSKQWVTAATSKGAIVIDNTNAFRMDDEVALVVPQVNWESYSQSVNQKIIANPNCSTIQMVRALKPIEDLYGIEQVVVSTYQAASGGGLTGVHDLKADARQVLEDDCEAAPFKPKKFSQPIAFNVLPHIDVFMGNGYTLEEQKMLQESRKILGKLNLRLTATAVRVPVINGHSEAIYLECSNEVDRESVVNQLRIAEELVVHDDLAEAGVCTPRFNDTPNSVHVGRIRGNPDNPKGLWLWVMADNLRIGAALNAIQIAEKLVESGGYRNAN